MAISATEETEKGTHLANIYTGVDRDFYEVLNASENEAFYISSGGHILRVLSIGGLFTNDQPKPLIIEFYNLHGNHIGSMTKRFESRAAFALLFTEEIRNATFHKLSSRPNFISLANNTTNINSLLPILPAYNVSKDRYLHPEI